MQQEVAELRASSVSPLLLQSQMQVALHPSNIVYSGPSTIERFQSFSVEGELKKLAPDVYKLMATIGTTHTLDSEGEDRETRLSDLRCVTSAEKQIHESLGYTTTHNIHAYCSSHQQAGKGVTLLMLITITCITFPGHYYAQSCWNMCFVLDRLELLKKVNS